MKNIKITLEYEGTNYCGFQKQKTTSHPPALQEEIEKALNNLTGEKIKVIFASRTDARVHALGQVINFKTSSSIPPERFCFALNTFLPPDIKALHSAEVDSNFHARYRAKSKLYQYYILNSKYPTSLFRNFIYWIKEDLNLTNMKNAAKYLLGKNDFIAFRNTGSYTKTTICEIKKIKISRKGSLIILTLEGDRFLRGMVRCIVGTLIEVGKNKRNPDEVKKILESKDRRNCGKTALPQGLFLVRINY